MFCLGRYLLNSFNSNLSKYKLFAENLNEPKKTEFEKKINLVSASLVSIQAGCSSYNPIRRIFGFFKAWNAWNELIELDDMTKEHWWEQSLWSQSWFSLGLTLTLVFLLRHFVFGLYCTPTGSAEPNILVGDRIIGTKYTYFFKPIERGELVIFNQPTFVYDQESIINRLWQKYVGIGLPIFGLPNGPEAWVKRVIAVAGDTIEGRIENGKTVVFLNGQKLDEPYLNPHPLITIKKEVGLVSESWGLPTVFNKHTVGENGNLRVTYDPTKPYDKQPFYNFTDQELFLGPNGSTIEYQPRSPSRDDVFGPMKVPAGKIWCMGDNRKNSADCRSWGFLDASLVVGRASRIIFSVDSHESWCIFDLIKHPIEFFTKHLRYSRFGRSLTPFTKIYPT